MFAIPFLCIVLGALQQGSPAASKPDGANKPAAANAWPKLDAASVKDLGLAIDSLKRTPTSDGVDAMVDKIKGFGKGAVPYLYESLTRQKAEPADSLSEDARRLVKALDAVTSKEDGARFAQDSTHRNVLVKRFALRKAGEFAVAEALPVAKNSLTDADDDVRFEAALTCAALGSLDGFDVLKKIARDQWPLQGARVRAAIEKHRSEEATQKTLPLLKATDWQDLCAAMRLLAGWGVRSSASDIARFLDTTDNRVKENCINALRGIVDHEGPIEKLSAFDLAEQAIAWKKKL